MIDVCICLIQNVCGAWHAKLPFVRDPEHMLCMNDWFARGMKGQDVGSVNSGNWMEDDRPL